MNQSESFGCCDNGAKAYLKWRFGRSFFGQITLDYTNSTLQLQASGHPFVRIKQQGRRKPPSPESTVSILNGMHK